MLALTEDGRAVLDRAVSSSQATLASPPGGLDDQDVEVSARLLARFVETSRRTRRTHSTGTRGAPLPDAV